MSHSVKIPKKLIEVALPLDAINEACAYEKMPGIGAHPRGLHLWWARRPLAAARAVIFAQMVNDPSWKWELDHPGDVPPNNLKASWAAARNRLFTILRDLVKWENTGNEEVLSRARAEIRRSWRETCELNGNHPEAAALFDQDRLPAFHDPFAGGGAIPLEAQRLGFESLATDLNPVAVLINKAMIEIPPRFADVPPVNRHSRGEGSLIDGKWKGAQGLSEDVRHYGRWINDEALRRIGHLYPSVRVTQHDADGRSDLSGHVGKTFPMVAWIWARTVKSPNPAFTHVHVPLVSSFVLSNKAGKEAYVHPVIEGDNYKFTVRTGTPPKDAKAGTKLARGANFRCILSGSPIPPDHIKAEGMAGRLRTRLMAVVADGGRGRLYLSPDSSAEQLAASTEPSWRPTQSLPLEDTANFWCSLYGLTRYCDLFTPRQLVALTTLSDLVIEAKERVYSDAIAAGMAATKEGLEAGGTGARAYAEALAVYLAFALDRSADFSNSCTRWVPGNQKVMNLFGKQAVPMTWDFPEAAVLNETVGGFVPATEFVADCILKLPQRGRGRSEQRDAANGVMQVGHVVSTDPPYYDNIGYADLSDFFYIWLRHSLRPVFPELFATMTVPKNDELVATPFRHGGREQAESFFLEGMTKAMARLARGSHPAVPITIYYAFKQTESTGDGGTTSTGWETFLEAVLRAGLSLTGTWPLRSEQEYRMIGLGTNALASSIVLVCRPRRADAPSISRRAFLRELNQVLPDALDEMTKGAGDEQSPVAPVDLSQAIIGPGMAVFSRYGAVLEADGMPMSVHTALQLINRFLAEDDFDHDTQFCLHWFEQHGWRDGKFGDADTLARAKGTSVDGVKQAGVLAAGGGIVRLLKWSDYPTDWDPTGDARLPVWEVLHQVIRIFKTQGESGAGVVLAAIQVKAEATRQLAYRLYTLCERAGWADDARAYNEIVTSWGAIETAAAAVPTPKQSTLFN